MTAPARDRWHRFTVAIPPVAAEARRILCDRAGAGRRPGETLHDAAARIELELA